MSESKPVSAPEDAWRTKGEPTPRPWRVGSLVSYNGATGEPEAFIYRLHPDDPRETAHNRICVRGTDGAMDCDADARYIVRAVNSHEALVANLAAVTEQLDLLHEAYRFTSGDIEVNAELISCARAALEKAKS